MPVPSAESPPLQVAEPVPLAAVQPRWPKEPQAFLSFLLQAAAEPEALPQSAAPAWEQEPQPAAQAPSALPVFLSLAQAEPRQPEVLLAWPARVALPEV